jgi:hypothetical protein
VGNFTSLADEGRKLGQVAAADLNIVTTLGERDANGGGHA